MRLLLIFLILAAGGAGFILGKKQKTAPAIPVSQSFPVVENKTFAIIVYACNQGPWCQKTLRSIFEQDYDYYRVIFIDDASNDDTFEKAKDFVVDSCEEHRVVLIRNEKREGFDQSVQRAAEGCLDKEIALLLHAKDWFVQPSILTSLNETYQDPNAWLVFSSAIQYPAYAKMDPLSKNAPCSFYAGMGKQIQSGEDYLPRLKEMAKGHTRYIPEPTLFFNAASSSKSE